MPKFRLNIVVIFSDGQALSQTYYSSRNHNMILPLICGQLVSMDTNSRARVNGI